jgi:hypothetical protein
MRLCKCTRCGEKKEQQDMFNIYEQVCQECYEKSYDRWLVYQGAFQGFDEDEESEEIK